MNEDELKASYKIRGVEIFGLIITTRKQLQNCNIKIEVGK